MRIAVVGSGISGLVAARILHNQHEVTLFEADARIGGHANTVSVRTGDEAHEIDAGFIVFNQRTYPNFTRLLELLDVATVPTSMSFSVRCDRTGTEYASTSLNGLFAQRSNALQPSFLRMLRDIFRFNREGLAHSTSAAEDVTVGQYLKQNRYSSRFARQYLLPMGAAIWSCPQAEFARFPIRFILEFYANHGLLSLRDRPVWRVIRGGSQQYVRRLVQPFSRRIRLSCPIHSIRRLEHEVLVRHAEGCDSFDEVVLACHSDQALKLLSDPDPLETELLSAFPYSSNKAVLHTDESVLPRRRRAWASWNYHVGGEFASRPTVTYNMNILQRLRSRHTFCVTLNNDDVIAQDRVLAEFRYSHPLFTTRRFEVQRRHHELIRHRRTSFCGAYWRNGFHEDGIVSALAVCRRFGRADRTLESIGSSTPIRLSSSHSVAGATVAGRSRGEQ